jgi:hypothetical protein
MFSGLLTKIMSSGILTFAVELLPPAMFLAFLFGAAFRVLIWYTVRRHDWFAQEFEKRVNRFIESETPGEVKGVSFYALTKKVLERTFYEVFELRDRMNRRKKDKVDGLSDRIFVVRQGCAWLVRDILKQLKFLKWHDNNPKLINITRATFQQNPCFNRVFGIVPLAGVNDIINILPGMFVIGGIFGTFMGIVNGLPKLGGMNLQDIEMTKTVMDGFLFEVSYAMNSSIMGILFSVLMTFTNTIFSPEKVFVSMVDRFENSLDLLWYRSDNNDFPKNVPAFDEHRDPVEALAEESLNSEINKGARSRNLDEIRKVKAS